MPDVRFDHVSERRGDSLVLDDVSFTAPSGAVTIVVGASGSGKSSLLRAVAGLDRLDAGRILLGERDVTDLPPGRRDVSLTFSDPTLYTNRTVAGNIAFPLEQREATSDEIAKRVGVEARVLQIDGLLRRNVTELSAGEAQMVQLARALVSAPSVLLLDEPFAAIGGERAELLRREVRLLQLEFGTTIVMTTNDPLDVRTLADHVGVLEAGRVTQFGSAREVFDAPATVFAAHLTGDAEVAVVTVETDGGGSWLVHPGYRVRAWQPALRKHRGRRLQMITRPEWWELDPNGRIAGIVERRVHWSGSTTMTVAIGGQPTTVRLLGDAPDSEVGDHVRLRLTRWVLIDPLEGFQLDLSV